MADRRTARTRAALMAAFVDLVLNEGYDAVTVERVAERANVGRSTFYMHYRSKTDIMRESLRRPSSVLSVIVGHDLPRELLLGQLQHFHEQRQRNRVFFENPIRDIWVSCLAEMIEPRLATLNRQVRGEPLLPLPFIARQVAHCQVALIQGWLVARALRTDSVAEALTVATRSLAGALLRTKPGTPLFISGERIVAKRI